MEELPRQHGGGSAELLGCGAGAKHELVGISGPESHEVACTDGRAIAKTRITPMTIAKSAYGSDFSRLSRSAFQSSRIAADIDSHRLKIQFEFSAHRIKKPSKCTLEK